MPKPLQLTMLLSALVLLSACAETTATTADLSLVCPGWKQITITKSDQITEPTAKQIEGNNEARKAAGCTPPTPAKAPAAKQVASNQAPGNQVQSK